MKDSHRMSRSQYFWPEERENSLGQPQLLKHEDVGDTGTTKNRGPWDHILCVNCPDLWLSAGLYTCRAVCGLQVVKTPGNREKKRLKTEN